MTSRAAFFAIAAEALALGGCAPPPAPLAPPVPPALAPRFDPLAFFTGELEGKGRLKKAFSRTEDTLVESRGRMDGGVLHLTQVIHEGTKPARTREWTMRQAAFLRQLSATHSVAEAARSVGMSRQSAYRLRSRLKGGAFDLAWKSRLPSLVRRAGPRRARTGIERGEVPVFFQASRSAPTAASTSGSRSRCCSGARRAGRLRRIASPSCTEAAIIAVLRDVEADRER